MANKGKGRGKKANGKNCNQHNGASIEMMIGKMKEVLTAKKSSDKASNSTLFAKYTDKDGTTRLLKLSVREISVIVHETAKASDKAYQEYLEATDESSKLSEKIIEDKTPRNASDNERESLKEKRAELRKEKKVEERRAKVAYDKALGLERATDSYAIVLSELLNAPLKEYKKGPRIEEKATEILSEDRDKILEEFMRKGRKTSESEIKDINKVVSINVAGLKKASKPFFEHSFDNERDEEMLKTLGASEVAEIDVPEMKATGDAKYPNNTEPQPIVDGEEKPTPKVRDIKNPYKEDSLKSRDAKRLMKILNGAAAASVLQNEDYKTKKRAASKKEKVIEEREEILIEVPSGKVAAAKKKKPTSKKATPKKSEDKKKETALLNMSEEDKENSVVISKPLVKEESVEKPLESEVETPTVGIPVPEADLSEAKREEEEEQRTKKALETGTKENANEVEGKEEGKVEDAEPITDGVKDDSVSGIDADSKTKNGTSKRALGKIITAAILVVLIILFGVWECRSRDSQKQTKAAANTTTEISSPIENIKSDNGLNSKSDEVSNAATAKDGEKLSAAEDSTMPILSSLDTASENNEKAVATTISKTNPPEFKVLSPANTYPVKMSAKVDGIPIVVNAYNGYAYVSYPETISDEEVDQFMSYLVNQQPGSTSNIGWTLEDKGLMVVGYPYYDSASDIIAYGDEVLSDLDIYILTSNATPNQV